MATVILDTDFLSSFLKIEQCDLIRALYTDARVTIPLAVYRELAATDLLRILLSLDWIKVEPAELLPDEALRQNTVFQNLGAGEQTCLLLARQLPDSMLLISDNKARQFARTLGLTTVNIPAFLLACKLAGLVNPVQMARIVEDLKNKDFYEFKPEVREGLLR
jgi:predicted nucleic acid-binding protein